MAEETTQDLPALAARFAEHMDSYNTAQYEAMRNPDALGFQIAMRRDSSRLLELREAIEAEGGIISGKTIYGPDDAVLATWHTDSQTTL